jgi:protoporphyrinogen oxidase
MYKYLILGAGPAGLTVANYLKQHGEDSFLVLEKEKTAGGLCRSEVVDTSPLDIGGGHFLDTRNHKVNEFLFQFMAESEWNIFTRISKIQLTQDIIIDYPIEANIWQLDIEKQVNYLLSISQAGCNTGTKQPDTFIDWINWKLGERIVTDYMLPYNQKMFGEDLEKLGVYWLEKLPNVSFEETLRSCLSQKAYGLNPGHTNFYYPKTFGYGELWLRMAQAIKDNIVYNTSVTQIDFNNTKVIDNENNIYSAQYIITTIPWVDIIVFHGMDISLQNDIKQLRYSSIQIDYFSEKIPSNAYWIYYPDIQLPYHRILLRHNFCPNAKGYWTETNINRASNRDSMYSYLNKYAYPLNTIEKPRIMEHLLHWTKSKNVIGLGRWGEHQHYNSDVTVERALNLAEQLIKH